jgi:ribosomal-protein-alanine N-acetyltransferase
MLLRDGVFSRLPTLDTPRLVLRRMVMADSGDIFDYSSDPEVSRHVLWEPHRSLQDSRAYLRFIQRQYRGNEPSSWGIVWRESGHVIGTIGFMWWNRENRSAEIGYSLHRAFWGKGIMTEALAAAVSFGFERMSLHRIEAQHTLGNPASGRVMEKCGMAKEGILRGRLYNRGAFWDVALYAILEDDWRRIRIASERRRSI